LTVIVNNFDTLSRLDKFAKSLELSAMDSPKERDVIKTMQGNRLAIEHLNLQTPDY
jgi:hypothetical protein